MRAFFIRLAEEADGQQQRDCGQVGDQLDHADLAVRGAQIGGVEVGAQTIGGSNRRYELEQKALHAEQEHHATVFGVKESGNREFQSLKHTASLKAFVSPSLYRKTPHDTMDFCECI